MQGSDTGGEFQDSDCSTHSCPYESDGWSCFSEEEEFHERELTLVACGAPSSDNSTSRGEPFDLESAPRFATDHDTDNEAERVHVLAAIEALTRDGVRQSVLLTGDEVPGSTYPSHLRPVSASLATVCQLSSSHRRRNPRRRKHPTTAELDDEITAATAEEGCLFGEMCRHRSIQARLEGRLQKKRMVAIAAACLTTSGTDAIPS